MYSTRYYWQILVKLKSLDVIKKKKKERKKKETQI